MPSDSIILSLSYSSDASLDNSLLSLSSTSDTFSLDLDFGLCAIITTCSSCVFGSLSATLSSIDYYAAEALSFGATDAGTNGNNNNKTSYYESAPSGKIYMPKGDTTSNASGSNNNSLANILVGTPGPSISPNASVEVAGMHGDDVTVGAGKAPVRDAVSIQVEAQAKAIAAAQERAAARAAALASARAAPIVCSAAVCVSH